VVLTVYVFLTERLSVYLSFKQILAPSRRWNFTLSGHSEPMGNRPNLFQFLL